MELAAPLVVVLDARTARQLTDEIRATLRTGHGLIVRAYAGRAWTALGYPSWDAYCAGEFTEARMVRLPVEQRREIVAEMTGAGMSTRAIASGLGIDKNTVTADRKQVSESQTPAATTGTDGKSYPRSVPDELGTFEASLAEQQAADALPTKRPPSGDRRAPLGKTTLALGADLGRVVRRLEKVALDDRLQQHADTARAHLGFEAGNALVAITKLFDQFGADRLATDEEARTRWASDLFTAADTLQRIGQTLRGETQ